jgi:hypothetical protein
MTTEREILNQWNSVVEKSKEKARKFINKLVAIDQNTSVAVGKLMTVEIDRLGYLKYPYCRLMLHKPIRYRMDGKLQFKMGEQELLFINKPEMVMDTNELASRFPKIYEEILPKIKTGVW